MGTGSTAGTCTTVTPPPGPDPEPDPTTCTDPEIANLEINVTMDLQSKGRWNHLLIPVSVTDGGNAVSGVCVDIDLDRSERHWDLLGTTDSNGNIVFKLSRALDDTPYTATVVNQSHFLSTNSDFTECKQIINNNLAEC